MGNCCAPGAPKIITLIVGSELVGLIGLEQAFLDVRNLALDEEEVAEKLLEMVKKRNYIVAGAERAYRIALLAAYKNYTVELR
ncbi:MAG: hypothetical protein K0B01_02245 [Syntrophobacterales bacterium]|nr:hypothetical protein [Syntrophobacterales bacterium]